MSLHTSLELVTPHYTTESPPEVLASNFVAPGVTVYKTFMFLFVVLASHAVSSLWHEWLIIRISKFRDFWTMQFRDR